MADLKFTKMEKSEELDSTDVVEEAGKKIAFLVDFNYLLSTRCAVPSGQKTLSPKETWAKRRLHSSCISHPSQSRDNIITPCYDTCHKLLIRLPIFTKQPHRITR